MVQYLYGNEELSNHYFKNHHNFYESTKISVTTFIDSQR